MSNHYNFKENKCWSCEFFHGHRQHKAGFGERIETDAQGTCTNRRSLHNEKTVRENNYCSKYQKWGALQSSIVKQEEQHEETVKQEKKSQSKKKKNPAIIACIIIILIALAIFLPIIKKSHDDKVFNASDAGKVINYIRSKSNGRDILYSSSTVDGVQIDFKIQYIKNGFDNAIGTGSYSNGGGEYSFLAISKIGAISNLTYSACFGTAIFNWDNLNTMNDVFLVGEVWYQQYSVFNHYDGYIRVNPCPTLSYCNVYHQYGAWDNKLDLEEAKKVGWIACQLTVNLLNQISNDVFGIDLW